VEMDARGPAGMPAVAVGVTRRAPGGMCPPEVWFLLIRIHGVARRGVIAGVGWRSRRGRTPSALGCPRRGMPGGRGSEPPGVVVVGTVGGPGGARLAAGLPGGG
jgi:hypothetical protein